VYRRGVLGGGTRDRYKKVQITRRIEMEIQITRIGKLDKQKREFEKNEFESSVYENIIEMVEDIFLLETNGDEKARYRLLEHEEKNGTLIGTKSGWLENRDNTNKPIN
jgi:hypothetical protein